MKNEVISFDEFVKVLRKFLNETLQKVEFKITESGVSEYILIFSKPYSIMISLSSFYEEYVNLYKKLIDESCKECISLSVTLSEVRDLVLVSFDEIVQGRRLTLNAQDS